MYSWGFPGVTEVKNPLASAGGAREVGLTPGVSRGSTLQFSCLENSMDRGVWQRTQRVRNWCTWASTQKGAHSLVFYFYLLLPSSTYHCSSLPGPLLVRIHKHTTAPSFTVFLLKHPVGLDFACQSLSSKMQPKCLFFQESPQALTWNHLKTHWSSPFRHIFTLLYVKTKS